MNIDAMQQALKALESINEMSKPPMNIPLAAEIDGAMDALRTAIREDALDGLAQTSQEIEWDTSDMAYRPNGLAIDDDDIQEYKKPWVGLTDEEVGGLTVFDGLNHIEVPILANFARAIETKLREKNT